jgi:3-hydroxyacyl-CoA dehydrogenase
VKISKTLLWNSLFNPARYLKLFEIIPGPQTLRSFGFLTIYGEKFWENFGCCQRYSSIYWKPYWYLRNSKFVPLGKELGLTIEEVDKLTGPVIGRQNRLLLELLM